MLANQVEQISIIVIQSFIFHSSVGLLSSLLPAEVRTAEGFMSDVVWIELTVELTVVTALEPNRLKKINL